MSTPSQIAQLFRVALGLAKPWRVSQIEFSEEEHQLDLWLDFPAGSRVCVSALCFGVRRV